MNVNSVNSSEDSDENNEYEQIRKKNELAKLELFKEMGLLLGVNTSRKHTPNKVRAKRKFGEDDDLCKSKSKTIRSSDKPSRKSMRLSGKPRKSRRLLNGTPRSSNGPLRRSPRLSKSRNENTSISKTVDKLIAEPHVQREFFKGPEPMTLINSDLEDVKPSLQDLIPYFKKVPGGISSTSIQKSLDEFKTSLKKYSLSSEDVKKVGTTKTYSLLIHPSESKLLIITGDGAGYLSFWDVNNTTSEVEIYRPHRNPIYCLSLCSYNPLKLYATAIDGVLRSCDLEKMEFNDIYVTQPPDHTVHHCQMSPHTLLVAHGCGSVGLVDIRESKNPSRWIECHARSVRTVQQHPLNEYEFVTASGIGEVGLWDLRNSRKQTPLMLLTHPKALKSAFFSPGGGMLLTTCNDDRIRIYAAGKNQLIMSRNHNLQTGRWLRPLTAMWHPSRDDAFIIGSMSRPREVNIFGIHGLSLHHLQSPYLNTVLSNCHFHESLPVIAGANSSGYVHVFRGPS